MVGARQVSKPDAPRLAPELTLTRRTGTAAPYAMIVAGSPEWIAAEWPAPPMRNNARAAPIPRCAVGTRTKPSTGQSFSWASGSSGTTAENGARRTRCSPHPDAGLRGDERRALPDELGVEVTLRKQPRPHLIALVVSEEMGALSLEVAQQRLCSSFFDDEDGLVRAEDGVVEALRVDDAPGGLGQIGRRIDEDGDVARSHSHGRRAGAVRRRTTAVPPVATMTFVRRSVMRALMRGTEG